MRCTRTQVSAACGLLLLGLVIYARGFLTSRIELPNRSCLGGAPAADIGSQGADGQLTACQSTGVFDKAVVLILDALRSDFLFASPHGEQWTLRLPRMQRLVQQAGDAAFAAEFVADAPTITMSRLKALLTGSLPTFLDIGQSFSAARITDDNLLEQLATRGWRMVFTGDDTWMQLAGPELFQASHPFPSLNVHDLHTVDDGVWKHMQQYLATPESWDLLLGHYLGVDHAGHSHGVNSSAMNAKLAQLDAQVAEIAGQLLQHAGPGGAHERTLLLVLSDHGQTMGGDHGGASREETHTLLLAFNMNKWWAAQGTQDGMAAGAAPAAVDESKCHTNDGDDAAVQPDASTDDRPGQPEHMRLPARLAAPATMSQLDFTATVAMLLGVPVPYSNLGGIDAGMWRSMWSRQPQPVEQDEDGDPDAAGSGAQQVAGSWELSLSQALAITAQQVDTYLGAYAARARLPSERLHHCQALYKEAMSRHAALHKLLRNRSTSSAGSQQALLANVIAALQAYLAAAAQLARAQFVGFDLWLMAGGILVVAVGLLAHLWLVMEAVQPGSADRQSILQRPEALGAAAIAMFQACSLFGVDWIMGEGRVQCACLLAMCILPCTCALLRGRITAAAAVSNEAANGVDGDSAADKRHQPGAQAPSLTERQSVGPTLSCPAASASQLGTARRSPRVALAVACAVTGLTMMVNAGLIDRSGQDPHDKAQHSMTLDDLLGRAQDKTGGPQWELSTALLVRCARTLLPCITLPWLLNSAYQGVAKSSGRLVNLAANLQLVCCTLWWASQLFGLGHLPLSEAASALNSSLRSRQGEHAAIAAPAAAAVVVILGLALTVPLAQLARCKHQGTMVVLVGALIAVAAWLLTGQLTDQLSGQLGQHSPRVNDFMSTLSTMPLQLLLPRVVYTVSAVGVLLLLGLSVAYRLGYLAFGGAASNTAATPFGLISLLLPSVLLVLGARGPLVLLGGWLVAFSILTSAQACAGASSKASQRQAQTAVFGPAIALHTLGATLFFTSGHFCEFTGLQYASPFIGFDESHWLISGVLMALNTFGSQLLASLAVGLLPAIVQQSTAQGDAQAALKLAVVTHSAARGMCTLMVLLCAFVLRSHIVVWAIIAPRFVFEAFNLGVMVVCMLLLVIIS